MLLRSMTKHVRDQNWFAVGLDFFIVVFGVFMGFQVQLWNEHRGEKSDTREYVERLTTDMEISIAQNDTQIEISRDHVQSYNLILKALDTCQLAPAQKPVFGAGMYNLGKVDMPIMVMGTIDELNATGSFPLIGDVELRRQITEAIRGQQTILAIDNQITARVVPHVNYVRAYVRFNLDEHLTAQDEIDPEYVSYDLAELCADKKFINAIAAVREMTLATIAFSELTRNDQVALVVALNKRLDQSTRNPEAIP